MILVTVGGQLPFDRLVHAVDRWAEMERSTEVFAQIGSSEHPPRHISWQRFLSPSEFETMVKNVELIVSHAGIGTILGAIDAGKPIVVMPRRSSLGEHRNDHQWATVNHLHADLGVHVARDEDQLPEHLARARALSAPSDVPSSEHERLLRFVRAFVGEPLSNAVHSGPASGEEYRLDLVRAKLGQVQERVATAERARQ